jgi:hypothetical protein
VWSLPRAMRSVPGEGKGLPRADRARVRTPALATWALRTACPASDRVPCVWRNALGHVARRLAHVLRDIAQWSWSSPLPWTLRSFVTKCSDGQDTSGLSAGVRRRMVRLSGLGGAPKMRRVSSSHRARQSATESSKPNATRPYFRSLLWPACSGFSDAVIRLGVSSSPARVTAKPGGQAVPSCRDRLQASTQPGPAHLTLNRMTRWGFASATGRSATQCW